MEGGRSGSEEETQLTGESTQITWERELGPEGTMYMSCNGCMTKVCIR